jgi:hypothetical protein
VSPIPRAVRAVSVALLLVAAVVAGCATSSTSVDLKVGDCFDVPTSASIASIPTRPCSAAHGGEVFHVFDASGTASEYPSDEAWGQLIYPVCDPVFESYTGTPIETRTDIDYAYLVPTSDRWASGDRRVTCFIRSPDGAPVLRSYRKSG